MRQRRGDLHQVRQRAGVLLRRMQRSRSTRILASGGQEVPEDLPRADETRRSAGDVPPAATSESDASVFRSAKHRWHDGANRAPGPRVAGAGGVEVLLCMRLSTRRTGAAPFPAHTLSRPDLGLAAGGSGAAAERRRSSAGFLTPRAGCEGPQEGSCEAGRGGRRDKTWMEAPKGHG